MNNCNKYLLFLLLILSFSLSDSGYNTIYLMEFDNLQNNSSYSNLKNALPELIKENYSFRHDITIQYVENIDPYIEKYKPSEHDTINAFIINGRYETVDDKFYIEFEAYDNRSWNQLVKRKIYCPLHDIACVHDAFIIAIEKSISPFLIDQVDIETTRYALQQTEAISSVQNSDNSFIDMVDDNEKLKKEIENNYYKQEWFSDQYYREFNLKELIPESISENQDNEQKLEKILEQILKTPYDVFINELQLELDPYDSEMIIVELPIEYSMINILSQELLTSLPYKKYLNENDDVIIQFSRDDFIFDQNFMNKLALTKFQIIPIIYLHDKLGMPQFIIIDSWNNKFENTAINNLSVFVENQFTPLFSLTPGIDKVQLTINTGTLHRLYRFSIPYEKIGDYTKVTVKFMHENELEKILDNIHEEGVN